MRALVSFLLSFPKLTHFVCFLICVGTLSSSAQINGESSDESPLRDHSNESPEERPTLTIDPPARQTLVFEFPPLTSEEIAITQTRQVGGGPRQVAFHRTIPNDMSGDLSPRLSWHTVDGNQYAYLKVRSPAARTLRLELFLRLPSGAGLRFYHVDDEGETHAGEEVSQSDIQRLREATHWTTPVGADHLSIEIRIPYEQNAEAVQIELKSLSHGFVSAIDDASTSVLKCSNHIQVSCAINDGDTTQETADSVVRINFESGGAGYQCTAALISDISQTTPYLLTAAHCISTESEAASISPLWFFQVESCGTTTVDPRITATLGGGDLVAASVEDDMSLIQLRYRPPLQAVYASWDSSTSVSLGTNLIGIHHPEGYDKKLWKGAVSGSGNVTVCDDDQSNCFLVVDGYKIDMSSGSTEPGSSGSPVFLSGTNTIVGVHSASDGECDDHSGFSGRFSNFYPLVEEELRHGIDSDDQGTDLVDDHGNDLANATSIALNATTRGSIETAGDEDWFSLYIPEYGDLTVNTGGTTNTVGQILDSNGSVLAEDNGIDGGNFEITISLFAGTFYIKVSAPENTVGEYLLITEFEEIDEGLLIDDHGNDVESATNVILGQATSGYIETDGDIDFFRVELSTSTQLISYTSGSLDTLGQLLDEDGEVLSEDDDSGTGRNFRIESELEPGTYFLRISAWADTTGPYVLNVETSTSDEPPGGGTDGDHGDTRDQATVVQVGSETEGTIDPSSDVDFFQVNLTEPGQLTVYTSGPTDTYGRLTSADGTISLRDDDDGRNFNFHISAEAHADSYYFEVTSYQDKTGDYVLHVEFEPWVLDLNSISLAVSTSIVEEHDRNQVEIFVNTDEPVRKDEIIELQLSGTATNEVDYTLDSSEVTLTLGTSQGSSTLTPYRDWIKEGNETIEIEVVYPTNDPTTELAKVTLMIEDIFKEEGPVYQTRRGSDLIPLANLRGGQDTLTIVTTIHNVGSEESKPTNSDISLYQSADFDISDELMRWEFNVPELDSHGGSYRQEFDIDLKELQPDTTYYARVQVATTVNDAEMITDNDVHNNGFALDENHHLRVSCETPSDTSSPGNPDPLLPYQWHIRNTGQFTLTDTVIEEGIDLNITQSLDAGLSGEGITIAVIDTGLEICHPDLYVNADSGKSVNFLSQSGGNEWPNSITTDPFNPKTTGDHGTSVAGIIAATSDNGIGGRGVAPKVRLQGFNFLQKQSLANLVRSVGGDSSDNTAQIAVLGFGSFLPTQFDEELYSVFGNGTRFGRDSRGTLYIKPAGNSFAECNTLQHVIHSEIGCRNANSDALNNIPHVLVVGAFDALGQHATYSNSGSNLWISAPSGIREPVDVGLITTDQFGPNRGYGTLTNDPVWSMATESSSPDYISTFIGTSGAAAQVGGAVALLLEVEPALTFREIKHILATTAQSIDPAIRPIQVVVGSTPYILQQAWTTNAAGFSYHTSFGFGAIDVDAAVKAAENWQPESLGTFAVSTWIGDDASVAEDPVSVPDHDGAGVIKILSVEQPLVYEVCDEDSTEHHCLSSDVNITDETAQIRLEAVSIRLKISHPRMSDLGIHLISPSGTESVLNTVLNNALDRAAKGDEYFYFLSNAFYGEDPFGEWKLKVVDVLQDEVGEILAWDLRFYVGQHPQ